MKVEKRQQKDFLFENSIHFLYGGRATWRIWNRYWGTEMTGDRSQESNEPREATDSEVNNSQNYHYRENFVTEYGEIQDGMLQLRFTDDAGNIKDISASELAETLQGLVEFTNQLSKNGMFGNGPGPEVRVRPPVQGSFVVETIFQWTLENPEATANFMAAGTAVAAGLRLGIRRLRGEECKDFDRLANGNVKVVWSSDVAEEIPAKAWDVMQQMKRPTRRALRKIMAPLGDDVDQMEIRDALPDDASNEVMALPAAAVATRADYRVVAKEQDEILEDSDTFTAEVTFQNVDFREGEKWLVKTANERRRATVTDDEFLRSLDNEQGIHKNDIFDVTISESRTTKNGRTTREWELSKVTWKRRGGNDDSDQVSRGSSI